MAIYLIRHTTPKVQHGTCYGQADLDVLPTFESEANAIIQYVPTNVEAVYSSPLKRCTCLAGKIFAPEIITYHDDLKEINCGAWELLHWDAIPKEVVTPFLNNIVDVAMPGGESYGQLYARVNRVFRMIADKHDSAAIVAHGGVIRSILSHITQTPLVDAFKFFKLYYGCVVKLNKQSNGNFVYEVLHNVAPAHPEQHRPSK